MFRERFEGSIKCCCVQRISLLLFFGYCCSSLRFDDDSNIDYDDDMENVVLQERVIELMTEEFREMNVFMESNCGSVERRCVPFFQCFQFLKRIFSAC